jgi:hypothetical protein
MIKLDSAAESIDVRLTRDELLVIHNALNEVLHGIDVPEFHTRLGVTPDLARDLLRATRQADHWSITLPRPMLRPRATGLLLESLKDVQLALEGLTDDLATERHDGASSIAWTAAHVTQGLDSLVLYRFAGRERDAMLSDAALGAGGSGTVTDWPALRAKIAETQAAAEEFLRTLTDADLTRTVPYDGSILSLRPTGINLEYALLRVAAHHFTHAGEIAAIRSALGLPLPDNRDWGRLFL